MWLGSDAHALPILARARYYQSDLGRAPGGAIHAVRFTRVECNSHNIDNGLTCCFSRQILFALLYCFFIIIVTFYTLDLVIDLRENVEYLVYEKV